MNHRIHLCIKQPPGYVHSQGFLDQARFARYQFRRLGADVTIGKNRLREDAINIVFGAHLGFDTNLKDRYTCIFMNLEQLGDGGANCGKDYLHLLSSSAVMDYDVRNLAAYGCKEGDIPIISFQYAPYLSSTPSSPIEERPIDLLFFGSINERRRAIFRRIEACGWSVSRFDHPLYGEERDHFIRQSKAVFNCHFYESSRFEQARAFHSLSLGTPVISERTQKTTPPPAFEDTLTWITDDQLETFFTEEFMKPRWLKEAQKQLQAFEKTDASASWQLAHVYCKAIWDLGGQEKAHQIWRPTRMNLGSGKDYKAGWLNVDVLERTLPDLVFDLGQKVTLPITASTLGGGSVLLEENSLDAIYASNVLEHVPDLPCLLTNLLALLKEDGEIEIEMPFEKSMTAWQNPTHLRPTNKDSWLYYTNWFWQLGWFYHRFEIVYFQWLDSKLQPCEENHGAFMRLKLKKVCTTLHERAIARTMQNDFGGVDDDISSYQPANEPKNASTKSIIHKIHHPINDLSRINIDTTSSRKSIIDLNVDVSEADHQVKILINNRKYSEALAAIINAVHTTFTKRGIAHHKLYYPQLDRRIEELADLLTTKNVNDVKKNQGRHVIIATELYEKTGGHSRVIEDISNELNSPVIILTDLFGTYRKNPNQLEWIFNKFKNAEIIIIKKINLWEKCQEIQRIICRLNLLSISHFGHHQDPLPYIATLGLKCQKEIFFHHCDSNPSLGCTLANLQHVDFSPKIASVCTDAINRSASTLPLYVKDLGVKPRKIIFGNEFSVVTAGRQGKYSRAGPHSLQNIILATLKSIKGNFYHIGSLNASWIDEIERLLSANDINKARFIYLGQVTSLWAELLKLDVAFYISSAPEAGGRGSVEAQGCGLPVIYFSGTDTGPLIQNYSLLANTDLKWSSIDDLSLLLSDVGNSYAQLSLLARKYYLDNFSHVNFKRTLMTLINN
jgi:SAM-dependent methyltransferase